jgi:hypothetical protein
MTCYSSNMTNRREAEKALTPSRQAAGRREVDELKRSLGGDTSVRDLVAIGGLRGFTPEELLT